MKKLHVVTAIACVTIGAAWSKPADEPVVLRGHTAGVTAVRVAPGDEWIASSSLDGTVRLWSWPDRASRRVFAFGHELYDVAISPDGKLVAAAGDSRSVMIWNAATGSRVRQVEIPALRSLSVAFAGNNRLVIGSSDGRVRIVDVASGTIQREIKAGQEIFAVAVSRDGRYIASGLPLAVWNAETGERVAAPRAFAQGDVAFSSDSRWLASGEYTGGGRLFMVPAGELKSRLATNEEKRIQGPRGGITIEASMPVTAVTFSPDDHMLATAGGDRRIQLWQISSEGASEKPLRVLEGHSMTVTGVSFSSTGAVIASSSLDHTVRVWRTVQ